MNNVIAINIRNYFHRYAAFPVPNAFLSTILLPLMRLFQFFSRCIAQKVW